MTDNPIKNWLISFFFLVLPSLHAQIDSVVRTTAPPSVVAFVIVKDIKVEGAGHTKPLAVERELSIRRGDTILLSSLTLENLRLRVLSTGLFNDVNVNLKDWNTENTVTLVVKVREAFPIIPIPIIYLADRNFNIWWTEQNRALNRINYGISTTHRNLTGWRDPLQILIQHGYTPKLGFNYTMPGLNHAQTLGFTLGFNQSTNREIGFKIDSNRLRFFRNEKNVMLRTTQGNFGLQFRPKIFTTHALNFSFSKLEIGDTIANDLNPNYLGNRRNAQRVGSLTYTFMHDKRDFKYYPHRGYYLRVSITKNGMFKTDDFFNMPLNILWAQYVPLSPKTTWALETRVRTDLAQTRQVPFNFNRGLGFGEDYLRGYELYVVEGLEMGWARSSIRQKLFKKDFNLAKYLPIPIKAFEIIPIEVHFSANTDIGKTRSWATMPTNSFQNRTLWGYGVGLDFVLLRTAVFHVQYSFNHLNEGGIYFHYRANY